MPECITDKLTVRLSKKLLMAAMLCALALATAAPDIAFAHGGGGDGGHDGEPQPQETAKEGKLTQKEQTKLFWTKRKMNKALNKVIEHQEYMKKKLHSPEAYNYSAEQFVEDQKEEERLQLELEKTQKEVRDLCENLDVKAPTEASLVRPSVLTPADTSAVYKLKSEKSVLEKVFDDSRYKIQTSDMIAGTSDVHGDRPSGSDNLVNDIPLYYVAGSVDDPFANPMDYQW